MSVAVPIEMRAGERAAGLSYGSAGGGCMRRAAGDNGGADSERFYFRCHGREVNRANQAMV